MAVAHGRSWSNLLTPGNILFLRIPSTILLLADTNRQENEGFTAELTSRADRSLNFRTLQELRNIESSLLTMMAIFKATLATLEKLQVIGNAILTKEMAKDVKAVPEMERKELQSLAILSQRCQSYMNSVEIMQNRAAKLIQLVRRFYILHILT
jgi:hypothetical protein